MEEKFFRSKDCKEDIVMALSLDIAREKERIIIGPMGNVICWLDRIKSAEFYYDAERPLGTFLLEHEEQRTEDWIQYACAPLQQAMGVIIHKKAYENDAWEYLEEHLNGQNAVCKFTAYQCWHWYAQYKKRIQVNNPEQEYGNLFLGLSHSFRLKLWEDDLDIRRARARVLRRVEKTGKIKEERLDIRQSDRDGGGEWLIMTESFYPALQYYLQKLLEWDLCYCRCSVCKKQFLAPSKHHSLCSEECRAEQNRQNKRQFDARARENGYDIDYKNTSQRMRNRLNKLKKQEDVSAEQRTETVNRFKAFREEAISRKKRIRNENDRKAFQNWLFEQEREFEKNCMI